MTPAATMSQATCPDQPLTNRLRWPIRLMMHLNRISPADALNCGIPSQSAPANLAAQLKQAANALKSAGLDETTGRLDYRAVAESVTFRDYADLAISLAPFDPARLGDSHDRAAFWINLYNALIIHAVIAFGVGQSVNDIPGFFDRAASIIGGWRFSANDIEHGVLRANAGHPALPGPQFRSDDPRMSFVLAQHDARIHFALVCAARSCPPIGIYSAERLNAQLDLAARSFMRNGGVILDRQRNTVHLSRLFSWYAADFGASWFGYQNRSRLLNYVMTYLSQDDAHWIRQHSGQLQVRFLVYDWTLNV